MHNYSSENENGVYLNIRHIEISLRKDRRNISEYDLIEIMNVFAKEAKEICKDRVYTDHLRRYAYGVDASCYSYLPKGCCKG